MCLQMRLLQILWLRMQRLRRLHLRTLQMNRMRLRMQQLPAQSRMRKISEMFRPVLSGTMRGRKPDRQKFLSICVRKSSPAIIKRLKKTHDLIINI